MGAVGQAERGVQRAGGFGNVVDIVGGAGDMLVAGFMAFVCVHRRRGCGRWAA